MNAVHVAGAHGKAGKSTLVQLRGAVVVVVDIEIIAEIIAQTIVETMQDSFSIGKIAQTERCP